MTITLIEKIPDEHMLIVTYAGEVTLDEVRAGADLVAEYRAELGGGHVFGITDIRNMDELWFGDILAILREQSKGEPGTATDPDFSMVFVGTTQMVKLYCDALALPHNGGVLVPMFHDLDDAGAALRVMIAKHSANAGAA